MIKMTDWMLIGTTALAWYHVGFVWLVQVVAWPLFGYVGSKEFPAYHAAWWRGIRYILFIPSVLVFAGGLALLFARPDHVPYWLVAVAFGMTLLMWVLTAVWWGPQQARLNDPHSPRLAVINRSHWIRTALVTGNALALLAALSLRLAGT
jgi:hypothetical protein